MRNTVYVLYCGVMPSNAVLVLWYAKYTTLVNNGSSARIIVSIAPCRCNNRTLPQVQAGEN